LLVVLLGDGEDAEDEEGGEDDLVEEGVGGGDGEARMGEEDAGGASVGAGEVGGARSIERYLSMAKTGLGKSVRLVVLMTLSAIGVARVEAQAGMQTVTLRGDAGGKRFDGIGIVNGGGATSVLLKDYPEPQRSQILDMVYKPKFGASVSALLVEIPGDGNSTQGSMPSHMHTRDDLDYSRGYMWWVLQEAKKRNPKLSLDGTGWSAPGWVGNGNFWSQDGADYYVSWLKGLRSVYGLEFDAIGCRNEKGTSYDFAEKLRATLDRDGFEKVKLHCFDNWPDDKFDFAKDMLTDEKLRSAIDILSAHTLVTMPAEKAAQARELAAKLGKPIWNTEEHVYKKGFDDEISIVEAFNENYIKIGATKVVNWYDIAGLYAMEPYSETPSMLLARTPWSGSYQVREALWGYAHYGQFTEIGWEYLNGGSGVLAGGGDFVTLKSPAKDYSVILQTKGAKAAQTVRFAVGKGLSEKALCVWRSDAKEQFVRQADVKVEAGGFTVTLEPDSIYSISTTRGQRKGTFEDVPAAKAFPMPYYETFEEYASPKQWGEMPRYTADIAGSFELAERPDGKGEALRQVVAERANSWAPEWQPYTILGDDQWTDYEVSADVYLNVGDSAGVMGRVNDVGYGYGSIPKGYLLELGDDGRCRLVVVRGAKSAEPTGDAEQQALLRAKKDYNEGGEKELGVVTVADVGAKSWHRLTLRFEGTTITGLVDGKQVLSATDAMYGRGKAGLLAGAGKTRVSTPYFDDVLIRRVGDALPEATPALTGQMPMYGAAVVK
jgi:galactosylceramidase